MLFFLLISIVSVAAYDPQIGKCNLQKPPLTWLETSAVGISDWATAGFPDNTENFCIVGDKAAETIKIAYHIDVGDSKTPIVAPQHRRAFPENPNNDCDVDDDQIQYCIPLCSLEFQKQIILSALSTSNITEIAIDISSNIEDPDNWAVTVLQVDFNNPITHLNVSSFLDYNAWCSVYLGINPNVGEPYLLEIQLGKILH